MAKDHPLERATERLDAWRNAGVAHACPAPTRLGRSRTRKAGSWPCWRTRALTSKELPVAPRKRPNRGAGKRFTLPFQLRPGQSEMFVSIGNCSGTPKIALPLAHDNGHRRYRLGTVQIVGPTQ